MYKVFVYNKAVILTDHRFEPEFEPTATFIEFSETDQLFRRIKEFEQDDANKVLYVFNEDLKELWEAFTANYRMVEAAGGVVKSEHGRVLFIFRNHKWDLPKGKLENGESKEEGAVREVEEECGVKVDRTGLSYLRTTYHTFKRDGVDCLKKTFWYAMQATEEQPLVPETHEGITKVEWVAPEAFQKIASNTYNSILEVLENEVLG